MAGPKQEKVQVNGQKITCYSGNSNLKAAGVQMQYTQEQIDEFQRCIDDPIYFIRNYSYIISEDEGFVKFNLHDYQEKFVNLVDNNRKVICRFPRQSGKSTVIAAGYFLYYILFNDYKTVGILANKEATATEILSRLKRAYEALPYWLQSGVREWNKTSIELENGSSAFAAATSSDAIRGWTISALLLDEVAHIEPNKWAEFYDSVFPTISSGKQTKIIMVSTPKGMNHFYKFFNDAEYGRNNYVPYSITWREVPQYDEQWAEETRKDMDERKFAQEYEVDFLGSANTLISPKKLTEMTHHEPIYDSEGMKMYEKPKKEHTYVLTADVSQGKGQDYSAFNVIDITEYPFKQVATFYSNEISPLVYPDIIAKTGYLYNNAYVLIENNENGHQVLHILNSDLEYENILSPGGGKMFELGVRQSKTTKSTGCTAFKDLVESDKLFIQDYNTINELTGFILNNKGSYEADEGYNDDLAMSLVIFSWLTTQNFFEDLTDRNVRRMLAQERMEEIEEDLAPLPVIDDGLDDVSETWEEEFWTTNDYRLFGH